MLSDKGIVFQNETALFAYQLLKKYPEVAAAITERFPIIIIDEVQDTSVNQMAVFDLLSESGMKSMFLVGDPDQSIYEWRNANPECFIQKLEDSRWKTIELTGNFRSSQNICNVTSFFAASLNGTASNNAIGEWKSEPEKPVLLLTKNNSEVEIIDHFIDKCKEMQIEISPKNVAILTRGRIYSDTDISGLWKSKEIELYAKAAYEWKYGSRKKAYKEASKASYSMIFNEDADEYMMRQKIRECINEESWKDYVIDVLVDMPDVETEIAEWVQKFSSVFCTVCEKHGYKISPDKDIKNIFKIKQRDKSSPNFKKIPLRKFFEKKIEDKYTRSSIHGVKGESYDAVLVYIKSRTGSTITPKLLIEGALEQELMRLAYVAMTRPRRLLMLAMPDTKGIKTCGRFPEELWKYESI
jgi:superfamily I DNA/RNA helicase